MTSDSDESKPSELPLRIDASKNTTLREFAIAAALAVIATLVFYFSIKPIQQTFDYTAQIASALLRGHLGVHGRQGSWLNEFVPFEGSYYSVFLLGAVLSMVPVAALQKAGWIHGFPGRLRRSLLPKKERQ